MAEIKIPRENANDDHVIITKIHFHNGSAVKKGDVLFEFETSKASIEFEAGFDGVLDGLTISKNQQIQVDTIVGHILNPETVSPVDISVVDEEKEILETLIDGDVHISKAANNLLSAGKRPVIKGKWLTSDSFEEEKTVSISTEGEATRQFGYNRDTILVPFTSSKNNQRKVAEIQSLGANSSYFNSTLGISINIGDRRVANDFFKNSILDLVVYEASLLLDGDYADLNSSYIGDGEVANYTEVIPGIALDDLNNLTVASLPKSKNLSQLSDAILDVVLRFEDRKLKSADLKSTTFTITDLSNSDVDFVLPLINGWQSFIIAICRGPIGYRLFGTFDHRVTEGKRFGEFLSELKRRILLYKMPNSKSALTGSCFICLKTISEEKILGNRGLIKINDGNGEQLICRNCFEGW